jgi:siroheme decarboxylase
MDQTDLLLLKVAQDGLSLTDRPYQIWGEVLGISEEEVIDRLQALEREGVVRRTTAADWPYNLYTMVHSRSRDDCLRIAEQLSRQSGISDYTVLFSEREYKKISARI